MNGGRQDPGSRMSVPDDYSVFYSDRCARLKLDTSVRTASVDIV